MADMMPGEPPNLDVWSAVRDGATFVAAALMALPLAFWGFLSIWVYQNVNAYRERKLSWARSIAYLAWLAPAWLLASAGLEIWLLVTGLEPAADVKEKIHFGLGVMIAFIGDDVLRTLWRSGKARIEQAGGLAPKKDPAP